MMSKIQYFNIILSINMFLMGSLSAQETDRLEQVKKPNHKKHEKVTSKKMPNLPADIQSVDGYVCILVDNGLISSETLSYNWSGDLIVKPFNSPTCSGYKPQIPDIIESPICRSTNSASDEQSLVDQYLTGIAGKFYICATRKNKIEKRDPECPSYELYSIGLAKVDDQAKFQNDVTVNIVDIASKKICR